MIRVEEEAAYASRQNKSISIINAIVRNFGEDIVILARYKNQRENIKKKFGDKVTVLKMAYDGKTLLENADVFIGSGGTMTGEAALLGIPTISYNAVPNLIEKYLVKNKLVKRETNPQKITKILEKIFKSSEKEYKQQDFQIRWKIL